MKTTKIKEVQIDENHIITLMKYEQEATERHYPFTSYKIWESYNELATFEDLKLAYEEFDDTVDSAYIDLTGE